jgi:hypothetical protein
MDTLATRGDVIIAAGAAKGCNVPVGTINLFAVDLQYIYLDVATLRVTIYHTLNFA